MPGTKTITGIQRGPDFEREVYEPQHIEKMDKEQNLQRKVEANDPLIKAAVSAAHEVADSIGAQRVDIKYDAKNEMVIMAFMDKDGEEIVRQIPPEEVIRSAQRLKENRARFIESIM